MFGGSALALMELIADAVAAYPRNVEIAGVIHDRDLTIPTGSKQTVMSRQLIIFHNYHITGINVARLLRIKLARPILAMTHQHALES